MRQNPKKRMTADEMLRHPWTTGEKANQAVMERADEKLASFQEVIIMFGANVLLTFGSWVAYGVAVAKGIMAAFFFSLVAALKL